MDRICVEVVIEHFLQADLVKSLQKLYIAYRLEVISVIYPVYFFATCRHHP